MLHPTEYGAYLLEHRALIGRTISGTPARFVLFVALIFALNRTFWEPPLYIVAHGLKIAGGVAGGLVASKRASLTRAPLAP